MEEGRGGDGPAEGPSATGRGGQAAASRTPEADGAHVCVSESSQPEGSNVRDLLSQPSQLQRSAHPGLVPDPMTLLVLHSCVSRSCDSQTEGLWGPYAEQPVSAVLSAVFTPFPSPATSGDSHNVSDPPPAKRLQVPEGGDDG